ncbi:MAG: Uma2 family endonuclease [Planctomycetaceae bacterium]
MATVTQTVAEQRFLMHDVSWEAYKRLLADQENHRVRMTYDRGMLEFMSPFSEHEWISRLIGGFIKDLAIELQIPVRSGGSTTLRRELLEKGLEPDECFYIRNEHSVRGRDRLDIENESDPPPDIAVEVDITSSSINRMAIYAALGVAEVWRYNKKGLHFFSIDDAGLYQEVTHSVNLPMISAKDIAAFLERRNLMDEGMLAREFRQWVRETFGKGNA